MTSRNSIILLLCFLPMLGCAQAVQSQLDKFVESEKKKLPKVVDPRTTLVDMESKPKEIVYIYQLTKISDAEATKAKAAIEKQVRERLVGQKEQFAPYAHAKIKLTYICRGNEDKELFRFSVNSWEL